MSQLFVKVLSAGIYTFNHGEQNNTILCDTSENADNCWKLILMQILF